jgi:hypothetical protein
MRTLVAILLLALWSLHIPHVLVSSFVGSHFPWPKAGTVLAWPALLSEGVVIAATLCIPTAIFVFLVFRRKSLLVVASLSLIFFVRNAFEFIDYAHAGKWQYQVFVVYLTFVHVLALVGTLRFLQRTTAEKTCSVHHAL